MNSPLGYCLFDPGALSVNKVIPNKNSGTFIVFSLMS